MLKKGDKVRVVKSEREDDGKSGVVIVFTGEIVGKGRGDLISPPIILGSRGDRLYEVRLNGEKGTKLFLESDLELISNT